MITKDIFMHEPYFMNADDYYKIQEELETIEAKDERHNNSSKKSF